MTYSEWNQTYASEFMSLKCAGDVLNIVSPLGSKSLKEISETMACIKKLRPIFLKQPMELDMAELCAGNALTSVLACHLLPVRNVSAFDVRPRNRKWMKCDRFNYFTQDIKSLGTGSYEVLVAVHPCKELAVRVIEIYMNSPACKHLVLMPCCKGGIPKTAGLERFLTEILSPYDRWCLYLARMCGGDMVKDRKCLSPCNMVITAHK